MQSPGGTFIEFANQDIGLCRTITKTFAMARNLQHLYKYKWWYSRVQTKNLWSNMWCWKKMNMKNLPQHGVVQRESGPVRHPHVQRNEFRVVHLLHGG